jgi:predicted metallopeptidase
MKKKNKTKKYLKIISQIENIRKKNNVNWMNILRIAIKYNPKSTAQVMSKIYSDDKKISTLVKKLI